MRVTQIEEFTKSRYKVYIDEEFAFVLYKGELRRFHVQVGEELQEADWEAITGELLPRRARLRAMNLLKNREYTVKQLGDKLRQGGYPEEAIEQALSYVAGFHYTDDLRYAGSFIRNHEGDRSRRRIEQDLLGRGIDRDTLEQAWNQWEDEGGSQDEMEMIHRLLEKKGFRCGAAGPKEKQRMYAFLMRKGFPGELVGKALQADVFCD